MDSSTAEYVRVFISVHFLNTYQSFKPPLSIAFRTISLTFRYHGSSAIALCILYVGTIPTWMDIKIRNSLLKQLTGHLIVYCMPRTYSNLPKFRQKLLLFSFHSIFQKKITIMRIEILYSKERRKLVYFLFLHRLPEVLID